MSNTTSRHGTDRVSGLHRTLRALRWPALEALLCLSAIVGPVPLAAAQQSLTADFVNIWTSPSERAAKQAIADNYTAAGGKFVDVAVGCGTCGMSTTIDRILAGDPPTATQFTLSTNFNDLVSKGLAADIDDVATQNNWRTLLPPSLVDAISRNGKVYFAPVDLSEGWIFYNTAVLKKAGVEPPTNFDDNFFATLDKIKAAGFIPLALGGNGQQYRWTFEIVMAGLGGKAHWQAVWADRDETAIRGPLQRRIFETFRRLHDYADQGSTGRPWAATAQLLISGKAGVMALGTWAKGEFAAGGMKAGQDFGCVLPGNAYLVFGDLIGFPKQSKPEQIAAQKLLAKVVFDRPTQLGFNVAKNALPPRTDIDITGNPRFDACSQKAAAVYHEGSQVVANSQLYLSPDGGGALVDLLSEYFTSKDMSTDEAIDRFASIVKNR
jgi:glucose/mannose transport system substrate-binding protein